MDSSAVVAVVYDAQEMPPLGDQVAGVWQKNQPGQPEDENRDLQNWADASVFVGQQADDLRQHDRDHGEEYVPYKPAKLRVDEYHRLNYVTSPVHGSVIRSAV